MSETSEAELDKGFTKTPSDGSDAECSQEMAKDAAAAKKLRDKAVAQEVKAAAAAAPSTSAGSKPATAAQTRRSSAVDKLRSQLGAARSKGLPVKVGTSEQTETMTNYLRTEDEGAAAAALLERMEKVPFLHSLEFRHIIVINVDIC